MADASILRLGKAECNAVHRYVRLRQGQVIDPALYHPPCFFREAGTNALDKAGTAWRTAFVTTSLQSLWAGAATGLGITLRTSAGIPPQLIRLDGKYGLSPLPRVDACLQPAAIRNRPP